MSSIGIIEQIKENWPSSAQAQGLDVLLRQLEFSQQYSPDAVIQEFFNNEPSDWNVSQTVAQYPCDKGLQYMVVEGSMGNGNGQFPDILIAPHKDPVLYEKIVQPLEKKNMTGFKFLDKIQAVTELVLKTLSKPAIDYEIEIGKDGLLKYSNHTRLEPYDSLFTIIGDPKIGLVPLGVFIEANTGDCRTHGDVTQVALQAAGFEETCVAYVHSYTPNDFRKIDSTTWNPRTDTKKRGDHKINLLYFEGDCEVEEGVYIVDTEYFSSALFHGHRVEDVFRFNDAAHINDWLSKLPDKMASYLEGKLRLLKEEPPSLDYTSNLPLIGTIGLEKILTYGVSNPQGELLMPNGYPYVLIQNYEVQ
ncbi:MAG: hypothetical protein KKF44_04930 [Nanoarchaeota archaeon]|nr:hypothetical protein [Nanoarchaeota archaeon]